MPERNWCVIETDNFGGDYPDQHALSWVDSKGRSFRAHLSQNEAELIAKVLNDSRVVGDDNAPRYFRAVLFEHELD